jgi:diaminopimelate decarboxylase
MLLHGNVKTDEDLQAAMACGVGRIVLDAVNEIGRVALAARAKPTADPTSGGTASSPS